MNKKKLSTSPVKRPTKRPTKKPTKVKNLKLPKLATLTNNLKSNSTNRDSGDNPVVCVIPVFGRHKILSLVLACMKKQTHPVKILLVISNENDKKFADSQNVDWVFSPNQPLGQKFQKGIEEAKKYKPRAVMINGSDDVLSLNWVETMLPFLNKYDLVGKDAWFLFDEISKQAYHIKYKKGRILGAGRLFSKQILKKLNWKLFPVDLFKQLDQASLNKINSVKGKKLIVPKDNTFILCYKGKYQKIHPTNIIITNRNLQVNKNIPDIRAILLTLHDNFSKKKYDDCVVQIQQIQDLLQKKHKKHK